VLESDDGNGGVDVCAEGWAHPRTVGNITTVTSGVEEVCSGRLWQRPPPQQRY
jgi:hypothetical protein